MKRLPAILLSALLPAALPAAPASATAAERTPPVPELRGSRLELPGTLVLEAMAYEAPNAAGRTVFDEEASTNYVVSNATSPGATGVRIVRTRRPRAPNAATSRVEIVWMTRTPSLPSEEVVVEGRLTVDDPNGLFHADPRPDGSLAGVCIELRLTDRELGGGIVAYDEEATPRDEQGWEIRPEGPDGASSPAPDRSGARRLRADGRRLRVTVERGGEPLRLSESGRFSFTPDGNEECLHVFRFHAAPDPDRPGTATAAVEIRLLQPSPQSLRISRAEAARDRAVARLERYTVPTIRFRRLAADDALRRLAADAVPAPGASDASPDEERPRLRLRPNGAPPAVVDLAGNGVPLREALCELADLSGLEIRVRDDAFVMEPFDPRVRHLSFLMGTSEEENRMADAIESGLRGTASPPAVFRNAPVSALLPFLCDAAAANPACPPVRFALRLWQTANDAGGIPPDSTRVTLNRPEGAPLMELIEEIASQNRLLWYVQRRTVVFEALQD